MRAPEHIILSRTDSIGDVMLTLPMAGLLREHWPGVRITFLGRGYTAPILHRCRHVDQVLTLEELAASDPVKSLRAIGADALVHVFPHKQVAQWAARAGIAWRIGTAHRWWHWTTCTHRVAFSRRRSDLHEAQLNLKLLRPFGITELPDMERSATLSGFIPPALDEKLRGYFRTDRKHLVIHPRSKGSAVEWGLDRCTALIGALDPTCWHVFVTGTSAEAEDYRERLPLHLSHVTDTGGQLTLEELMALIAASDALVAASTGPLHIAAACGIRAIGLFAPQRPIHPGRWAPIGKDAHALIAERPPMDGGPQASIHAITVAQVLGALEAGRS